MKAILGQKVAPGYADRVLAEAGYAGQRTGEPLPGDHGAHGRFGDRARPRSVQWWVDTHQGAAAGVAAGVAVGVWSAIRRLKAA